MGKKDEMIEALQKNLDIVKQQTNEIIASEESYGPSDNQLIDDTEEDYKFARDRIKKLIDTSDEAIATMHGLATDAEHPRAFEVLGTLIKQASEMNQQLLDLQKQRKALLKDDKSKSVSGNSSTTNNAIFVGTTSELQKFLKDQDDPVVDV